MIVSSEVLMKDMVGSGLQLPVVVGSADCQVALYGHADDQVDGPTQGDPGRSSKTIENDPKKEMINFTIYFVI
jgi:hypothetical protein